MSEPGSVPKRATILLPDITCHEFKNWLEAYCYLLRPRYHSERGIEFVPVEADVSDGWDNIDVGGALPSWYYLIHVQVYRFDRNAACPSPGDEYFDQLRLIEFTIAPLSHDHERAGSEVTSWTTREATPLTEFFQALMDGIVGQWPPAEGQLRRQGVGSTIPNVAVKDLPPWFPKKPKTVKRWRDVYDHWTRIAEETREEYLDGYTAKPEPTYEEFRQRLASEGAKVYGDDSLRKILSAGSDGLLGASKEG